MKLFLLTISALVIFANACNPACSFSLCQGNGVNSATRNSRLQLRPAGIVSIPFVCRTNPALPRIGRIVNTVEARILAPGATRSIRMSRYAKRMVSPKFPKKFFGLKELNSPPVPGLFGVDRMPAEGNQIDFLDNVCVTIPIRKYEQLSSNPIVPPEIIRTRGLSQCISFRTIISHLLIDFVGDNSDNFDLSVTTPSGKINRFKRVNAGGRYTASVHDTCVSGFAARELVSWPTQEPMEGKYTVQVIHTTKCPDNADANWTLRINSGDEVQHEMTGTANTDRNKVVKFDFYYPFIAPSVTPSPES